jgi:hypothetical protein
MVSNPCEMLQGKLAILTNSWLKRFQYIHIVGDASSVGYGAFTPHGELSSPMVVSFDAVEIARMEDNQLSSVLRETKNARLAVETLIGGLPASQVAGKVCVPTKYMLSKGPSSKQICLDSSVI